MIIIPDVHGRTFWKDTVKNHENELIVFLGDYLDPYPQEFGINMKNIESGEYIKELREETIHNFKKIIEFKKSHLDNVILLLGNHDAGYMYNCSLCDCRTDHINYDEIQKLFRDNKDLFQLAYETRINNTHYIFSHAGIKKCWVDNEVTEVYKNITSSNVVINQDNIVSILNGIYKNLDVNDDMTSKQFYTISYVRGGDKLYGSCLWADIREWTEIDTEFENITQIVGHTQLQTTGNKIDLDINETSKLHCVDSRNNFILDENGLYVCFD